MTEVTDRIRKAPPQRFRRYSQYKDSGVEWLGEIPVHWESKVLKRSFRVVNGSTPKSGEPENWNGDIPWVTPDDLGKLSGRVLDEPARYITRKGYESCGTQMVGAGSLILSTRAPIGHLAISGTPVCTNQGCRSLVSLYTCSETYFYFQLLATRPVLEAAGRGSTFRELAREDLESVLLSVPPLDEQRAIAAFLDRETAKIDGLVERKERLIQLLQEKRTALITQAVTRGLDPNVPMKDSGVDWLGEIPAHWEVKRLKHVSTVENSGAYGSEPGEGAVDLPVCTTAHLTVDGLFLVDDMPERGFSVAEVDRYVGVPGDIFVVKSSGSNTNIISGKLGLVTNATPRIVFSNFLLRIRPSARAVCPKFLAYLLRSELTRERIRRMVATTTYPNINVPEYVASALALPSVDEQKDIATFLDRETAKIDVLIVKVRQAIAFLKEFHTALISAAVTGKIDVREEAA